MAKEEMARRFARSASAEMHSGFSALRSQCTMTVGQRIRMHETNEALKSDLERLESIWAYGIEQFGGPWLAGPDFSAVDAFLLLSPFDGKPMALR